MEILLELDLDRVAVLQVMVREDMHYPLEPERMREPTPSEVEEIRSHVVANYCRELNPPALPVDSGLKAWGI